jgi:hypothetical protein
MNESLDMHALRGYASCCEMIQDAISKLIR